MIFSEIKEFWKASCRGEPESAVEVYILGVLLYEVDESEGRAACSLVLSKGFLIEDNNSPSNYRLNEGHENNLKLLKSNPEIIRSYIKNLDPKLKLYLRKKEVARLRAKLLIKSKLKSEPTSIFLMKEEGYWKIMGGIESLLKNFK